ncbi:MAG: YlxR family protein [Clostridium sp.]|nr:YlxR family protein [Clostridium sp.]
MDESEIKRKCCACAKLIARNHLIKITRSSKLQELRVNPDSSFFGRSVYICPEEHCIEAAFKKGKIFKLLKVKPDNSLKEKIRAVLDR